MGMGNKPSTLAMLFRGGAPGGDAGKRPTERQMLSRGGEVDELDGVDVSDELVIAAEDIMDSLQGGGFYGDRPGENDSKVERASKEASRRAKAKILAQSLKAFFLLCDSEPHSGSARDE